MDERAVGATSGDAPEAVGALLGRIRRSLRRLHPDDPIPATPSPRRAQIDNPQTNDRRTLSTADGEASGHDELVDEIGSRLQRARAASSPDADLDPVGGANAAAAVGPAPWLLSPQPASSAVGPGGDVASAETAMEIGDDSADDKRQQARAASFCTLAGLSMSGAHLAAPEGRPTTGLVEPAGGRARKKTPLADKPARTQSRRQPVFFAGAPSRTPAVAAAEALPRSAGGVSAEGEMCACCLCGAEQYRRGTRPLQPAIDSMIVCTPEFADWCADQGRPLLPGDMDARDGPSGRVCMPCYNQIKKMRDVVLCSGCGDAVEGGRVTSDQLRALGWRTADPNAVTAVRNLSAYNGDRPRYAHDDRTLLCGLCRACVPGLMAGAPGDLPIALSKMDSAAVPADARRATLEELHATMSELHSAVLASKAPLLDSRLMAYLGAAAAVACADDVATGPVFSSSLFEQYIWAAYMSLKAELPAGAQGAADTDIKSRLKRRFNVSRLLVRLRTLDTGGPVVFVSTAAGASSTATGFVIARRVEQLAHALDRRRVADDVATAAMVSEARNWARRHATPARLGTEESNLRPSLLGGAALVDILEAAARECPTLVRFLEELVPDSPEPADLGEAKGRLEYGTRSRPAAPAPVVSVSARPYARYGSRARVPVAAARRAYLLCLMAFDTSQRAVEPFHALLAAVARMDGASETFLALLSRLGCAVSARTAHRHLAVLADLRRHTRTQESPVVPYGNWLVCALDNLDWTASSRGYGQEAKMAHLITSIIMHGSDSTLPAPIGAAVQPRALPPTSAPLIHKATLAEAAAYAAYERLIEQLVDELVAHARPIVGVHPAPSGAGDKTPIRVNVLMDTRSVVPVLIQVEGATGAAVKEALSQRYTRHKLDPADLTLTIDGRPWPDNARVDDVAVSSSTVIVARSSTRSLRLRLQEAIPHDVSAHAARVIIDRPVIGHSSDPAAVESTIKQLVVTAGVGGSGNRLHLLVAGDFQTYAIMLDLCAQSSTYSYLVPWIGDWHLLWHLQCNLISQYWDFGLKQLAILDLGPAPGPLAYLAAGKRFEDNAVFLRRVMDCIGRVLRGGAAQSGTDFVARRSREDRTFALWVRLLEDVTAVNGLHMAIRTGNFDLRQACLKRLAYLFHIQGKHNYVRLISTHLKQVAELPPYLLAVVRAHFSVSIWDHAHANLAMDEALEKTVNRTGKRVVRSVDGPQAQKELAAFPDLHDARQYLFDQLGLGTRSNTFPTAYLTERSLRLWIETLQLELVASIVRDEVVNVLSGEVASMAAADQFARAREIGEQRLERHILRHAYGVVPAPLTANEKATFGKLPNKLLTLTQRATTARKKDSLLAVRDDELEVARQVCLEMATSQNGAGAQGVAVLDVTVAYEQISRSVLRQPLCYTDGAGTKLKANKAMFTKQLARLDGASDGDLFQAPPPGQRFEIVIHDMLVALHLQPRGRTFGQFAAAFLDMLVTKPMLELGASTVVLACDNPNGLNIAKAMERSLRRAHHDDAVDLTGQLRSILSTTPLPARARWVDSVISNDAVRRVVIAFIREYALNEYIFPEAVPTATLIMDVGDGVPVERTARGSSVTTPADLHNCVLEADYGVFFLGARLIARAQEAGQPEPAVLISSVDTDVWVYALLLCCTRAYLCGSGKLWIARRPLELLNVTKLVERLQRLLPDGVPVADLVACFVISGCDYTSRWAGFTHRSVLESYLGCAAVLEQCLRRAGASISGGRVRLIVDDANGAPRIDEATYTTFVSYMHYVKFAKAFKPGEELASLVPVEPAATPAARCRALYDAVKARTMFATKEQRFRMPSYEAAQFHRLRAEFVLQLPFVGLRGGTGFPDVLAYGYALLRSSDPLSAANLAVQWDVQAVSPVVASATTVRCSCTTGCSSFRCACKKAQQCCTTTCRCVDCTNAAGASASTEQADDEQREEEHGEGEGADENEEEGEDGDSNSDGAAEFRTGADEADEYDEIDIVVPMIVVEDGDDDGDDDGQLLYE